MIAIGLVIVLVIAVLAMTGTPILPILAVFGGMIGVFVVLAGVVYGVSVWRNRPERSTAPQRTQKRKRALLSAGKEILPRPLRRVMPVILMWFAFMAILHYGAPDAWEAWYGNKRAFWLSQALFVLALFPFDENFLFFVFGTLTVATGVGIVLTTIEPSWLKWPQWPEWEEGTSQAPQAKDGTQRRERETKEKKQAEKLLPTEGAWQFCHETAIGEKCIGKTTITEYGFKKISFVVNFYHTSGNMHCTWIEGEQNICKRKTPSLFRRHKILYLQRKKGEFVGNYKDLQNGRKFDFRLIRASH